jgi:hypothetical protein
MDALIFHVISWPTLGCALLVYGFAPGALIRLIVLLYPRDHPRRWELISELYAYPRIKRPFWVAEQLETALFEGLRDRLVARNAPADPLLTWAAEALVRIGYISDDAPSFGLPPHRTVQLARAMKAAEVSA